MANTKPKVYNVRRLTGKLKTALSIIYNDRLTLYAAQSSFFIIISTIPFVILLLSLAKYVINIDMLVSTIESKMNGEMGNLLKGLLSEIVSKAGISLISLTAVSTFWSSSRGINSVMHGISEVYGIRVRENFVLNILRSFFYTICFILIIIGSLLLLVFGRSIAGALGRFIPLIPIIFELVESLSSVIFFIVLVLFFAFVYKTSSKRGIRTSKEAYLVVSDNAPQGFLAQLPGALFSAGGWLLFSFIYSIYIEYFPNASYIYGSIAAVVFMMLWLYACMLILLFGAELNKMLKIVYFKYKNKK